MLHIAAFTGGENVPSARCRVRQLIPQLIRHEILMKEWKAELSCYPPQRKVVRPFWAISTLAQRIPGILRSYSADAVLFQREMLSTFMTLESLTKKPRIFDVDDAIWLNSTRQFAGKLAQSCDLVICGNEYIADYFSNWNKNISVIATPIDTNKFKPAREFDETELEVEVSFDRKNIKQNYQHRKEFTFSERGVDTVINSIPDEGNLVIGWMGTSSNFEYVSKIENALRTVLNSFPQAQLRIVSDQRPPLRNIPSDRIEYIKWTAENEVSCLQGFSVGIMPLEDSLWARGKCSYKMLQYLACGVPVVVSPIGMNSKVLNHGQCGFAANDEQEWVDGVTTLLEDNQLRRQMGNIGRQVVLNHYSIVALVPELSACITRTVRIVNE